MKNAKKAPKAEEDKHKHVSDYQSGKNSKAEVEKPDKKPKPKK